MQRWHGDLRIALIVFLILTLGAALYGQSPGIESGKRYERLIIRNVMMIDGNGTPAQGPMDIVIEGNAIQSIRGARQGENPYSGEAHVIDGSGLYALPGLINLHAHIHDTRGRSPVPFEYLYKLWLSCGITAVRDVGSNTQKTFQERASSQAGEIVAPRIYLYMRAGGRTPEEARQAVQRIKKAGGDGVKIFGMDQDIMEAVVQEARALGLRVAHHVGVEETDARHDAAYGVTSIEHWYGVPDAALRGSQNFPYDYNYNDESDRFRYAGRLWREADPKKLQKVLSDMVANKVSWCPTFVIYESNRDLQRAKNQPWFTEYLHPVLEEYFVPSPANHGSYQWNWTTTDEVFWRENYQLWMKAVSAFADMGGVVGCGEDAGYIYMMYGFSLIRELELHQEAGFHPIDVIMHATGNNARILGLEDRLGRIRPGWLADVILVEGNPLKNLKVLYPTGTLDLIDGEVVQTGGVRWTIKDGFVYDAKALLQDVKDLVSAARTK
ncbi:MAG: amidohydrolase family protein [Candidatus Aminicenantaceae bacterium]